MTNLEHEKTQQLLTTTHKLGKSSEETTRTVQKIKAINASLVDITQKQYDVVNQVSADGEHIKRLLSESVNTADSSLKILHDTVKNMEMEFSQLEQSIHLFEKIRESTLALNKVARHTKMLALNTSVLGGSLGKDGNGINIVAHEMQELVKTCEQVSQNINNVVVSARDNVQHIITTNRDHMQHSLANTNQVEQALKQLIVLVRGKEEFDEDHHEPSVDAIISAVGSIEHLAQQVRLVVENTQSETETLNNEVEVSNQAVSDLIGVVTNTPITNLTPEEAYEQLSAFHIIDVRRADEFNDQLGHIANAKLCTINETSFKNRLSSLNKNMQYLFVCRSGGRSSKATRIAQALKFPHIFNLKGGMLAWDKCQLPVERN
jgi:rhodanese-related sulfurtransferase